MPNLFNFTTVMMAYARVNAAAGLYCEGILMLLQDLYAKTNFNPKLKPNAFVYNCLLEAYSKSGELRISVERADEILTILEKEYESGHEDMKPTSKTYTLAMICYAKSKEMGKARKTLNILRRMQKQYENGNELARPNVQAYSILINAAAFTNHEDVEEEKESLDIAKIAMKELDEFEYDGTNSIAYGSFLKACNNLNLPKELLENEAKIAFSKCCDDGQVNEYVISQLKYAVSYALFKKLIPNAGDVQDGKSRWNEGLPPSWSKNVPDKLLNDTKGRWWSSN